MNKPGVFGRHPGGLAAVAAVLLFCCPLFSATALSSADEAAAHMEAGRTWGPVRLDGRLDEPCWKRAAVYKLAFSADRSPDGAAPSEAGEVRLAWDRKFLYIAISFQDSDITASGEEDQMHHYKLGDTAEVFLKPEAQPWYWELYATPRGKKTSFWLPERGKLTVRSCGLRVAARRRGTLNSSDDTDTGWTAEMAMPTADLATPEQAFGPGSDWRILIGRYNYDRDFKSPELSMAPRLSRTNYHRYEEYASLELKR